MRRSAWIAACVPLLVALAACSGGDPAPAASPSEQPCTTELCRTYEQGYVTGDEALGNREQVTLSPGERARLPVSDGSAAGAVEADTAVARILCKRRAVEYSKEDPLGVDRPEYREAFFDGCMDGATPFLSGKPSRYKYEGPTPG
ncbi:hypothetical protein CP979_05290 [Streptomyces filamentosus]|nr:hypothetical protein CP979_05290 [Streptomyces filamentosus]